MKGFVLLLVFAAVALNAASQGTEKTTFEVASVKPNNGSTAGGYIRPSGGRFTASNITLKNLILYAYSAQDDFFLEQQVIGGPDWMDKDRFDVDAKAEDTGQAVTREQMSKMIQSLLEDRFRLNVHRGTREMQVYEMVVERGGIKMKPSADQNNTSSTDSSAPPRGTALLNAESSASGLRFVFSGNAVSMAKLASALHGMVQRPIIDKTNLKGLYDFRIRFSPEAIPSHPDQIPTQDGLPATPSDHPLLPILQEELGLKLQAGKA